MDHREWRRRLAILLDLSHLHHDHADGLSHFEGTPVAVSKDNWRAWQGLRGTLAGALPRRWPGWVTPQLIDLMAHPNEDLLREGYAAFARGDIEALQSTFSPRASGAFPGKSSFGGGYE